MLRSLTLLALAGVLAPAEVQAEPACALAVQVVDEAGGPVPGTTVRVTVGADARTRITGKEGVAELTALPCGEAVVDAGQPQGEWFAVWSGTTRTLQPALPATVRLVVVSRTEVTVRVADAKGRPVSSGIVSASGPGNGTYAPPDENGTVVAWLEPGWWQFEWRTGENTSPGYAPGPRPVMVQTHAFKEVGREPIVVDLIVESGERLEGRILDLRGQPLSGVHVFALHAEHQTSVESRADGSFVLDIPRLPVTLEPVSFERALAFDPPRLPVQDVPSAPLAFVGRPSERPLLQGRVVRKGSGESLGGARVQIRPDCGGVIPEGLAFSDIASASLETEPDGSFEARCTPECPFNLTAYHFSKAGASSPSSSAALDLPAGACDRDLLVELESRPVWVLEGTVTDRKGVPLEALPLTLFGFHKSESRDATWFPAGVGARTGEHGRFRIEGQGTGRYRLEVAKQGTPRALRDLVLVSKRPPGARFEVALESEDSKTIELRAVPGATVCAGAVDAKNAPLALHSMALYAAEEDVVLEDTRWHREGRGGEGGVCLEGVAPGRYRVLLGKDPGTVPAWYPGTEDPKQAVPVEVAAGMNELDPVVLRAVGGMRLTLPGWSGTEPPRIEYREPRPKEAAPGAAPRPWTALPAKDVKPYDDRSFHVSMIPVGWWEVRACAGPQCGKAEETRSAGNPIPIHRSGIVQVSLRPAETTSLLGIPLFPPVWPPGQQARLEADLEKARAAHEQAPDDPETLIWLGRRTAFLGRYREAVTLYSRGIARWPEDARILRHRGHRRIGLRRFEEAIADLSRAAKLMAGRPDEIEPDGRPDPAQAMTTTLHTNVWYHLGLAHFLKGEFEAAGEAFAACVAAAAAHDDMRVVASDWLYRALRRQGKDAEARKVLETVRADLPLRESAAFLDLLLLYRGERSAGQLLGAEGDASQVATRTVGVGHWHLVEGRPTEAAALFERVIADGYWTTFAYTAAEAELARTKGRDRP